MGTLNSAREAKLVADLQQAFSACSPSCGKRGFPSFRLFLLQLDSDRKLLALLHTSKMSGSQSSLSGGDEKFIPVSDKAISPVIIDEKARKSGRWKLDFFVTGFSTLIYLMSYVPRLLNLAVYCQTIQEMPLTCFPVFSRYPTRPLSLIPHYKLRLSHFLITLWSAVF